MFESEIYREILKEQLSNEIIEKFKEARKSITHRSLLPWSEHCTECAMPGCFSTCNFYTPRIDGKCQRFVNGIERLSSSKFDSDYILKIFFKKWGVLSTQANINLYKTKEAQNKEKADLKLSSLIHLVSPKYLRKTLIQKRYSIKKKNIIENQNKNSVIPDVFMVECYNPNNKEIIVDLTFRNDDSKYRKIPFQYKMELQNGYNKFIIPFDEIDKRIKTDISFRISLTPNNITDQEPLYFGLIEFLKFNQTEKNKSKGKIKCIVWDLDNTLWDGILIENGLTGIKLKEGIATIIKDLDQKGILQSVSSKNDYENAMIALKYFGLEQYFLFPEISWGPKSAGIKSIAKNLDIGLDTFLFVDDSVFEREEVKSMFPQLSTLDSADYKAIPLMKTFQVEATNESRNRRSLYLNEQNRQSIANDFEGEYFDFLKSCEIKLELLPLTDEYFSRVYELTQRTNQMNFSGNIYTEQDIQDLKNNIELDKYVLKCDDKYGDYGIVGFAIINRPENKLIDLMFSCRIQSKRVEHAFLNYCLKKYLQNNNFYVRYKETDRNKFSGQVFHDLGFETVATENGIKLLKYSQEKEIMEEHIIRIKNENYLL